MDDYLIRRMRLLAFWLGMIGLAVVLIRATLFPPEPPSQDWANGIYHNPCCARLTLRNGVMATEGRSTRYRVENGKRGNIVDVPAGISVREGHVVFGGTFVFVEVDQDRDAQRKAYPARALHIFAYDEPVDYLFTKQ